jgi:hypothetical protein
MAWPGVAAVLVSAVHIKKGAFKELVVLDGKVVSRISAFLLPMGPDTDPEPLVSNQNIAFHGCDISGQGFLFDDNDPDATPIEVMKRLLERFPSYADRVHPFVVGSDVNSRSDLGTDRFVIEFGRRSLDECRAQWPELVSIVESKVKPDRESRPRNAQSEALAARWWQWHTDRPSLRQACMHLDRVLVGSAVSTHFALAFQPVDRIFSHALNVFAVDSFAAFCCLQARPHEAWARILGSSMKDDLRYTVTDCFETFPFPANWTTKPELEMAGREYYDFRLNLMAVNNEGLTAIYNRFHNPEDRTPAIIRLRELHAALDRAVFAVYGWNDSVPQCEFILDYEDVGEEENASRRRRKPYRYRWADEVRDEVLARLLELNRQRAEEERVSGAAAGGAKPKRAPRVVSKAKIAAPTLFSAEDLTK